MNCFLVDTNVPVVANGKSEQANPDCVIACINALAEIRQQGTVLLDDALLIIHEYMNNLSLSGQPGPGDAFMKWVFTVQANEKYCKLVHITPIADNPTNFAEFPSDNRLAHFDPSDRKFVAVALASNRQPEIINAVDTDWAEHFAALDESGIHVKFLCPQHVCPKRETK